MEAPSSQTETSVAMNKIQVPTFSLPELRAGKCKDEFRNCLEKMGVFYLKNIGIAEASHARAVHAAMDFFISGSEEDKRKVTNTIPDIRRGYARLEGESTARVTNTGEYSDYSMAYSMGLSGNLFPSPEFERAFNFYFEETYSAAQTTAREVLTTIGANHPGGIDRLVDSCDPLLRLRYFPDVPQDRCAEREPLRMAPHYDLSIVTLIQQTPCANGFVSLQCHAGDRQILLPHCPDATIVLCGAVASIVSGGKVKAPRHQVRAPTSEYRVGSARTSSVFFLRPSADFRFSVSVAKACDLDVSLPGPTATFKEWISGNYVTMHTKESAARGVPEPYTADQK
jgi:deacetoxycephalosporin-C synthase/deacetoxycephalosporin-C hydroxylase